MNAHSHDRASRRLSDDRGTAIVEMLITMPLLFVLLFGIIDFGFTFNDWIAVRQGGREGARQMLVNTKTPGGKANWSCSIPEGFDGTAPAAGSEAMNMVCFTKDRVGLDEGDTRVKIYAAGAFAPGKPVKVCVQYRASSFSGVFASVLDGKVLNTEVESLIEHDAPSMVSVEETPLPGTAWSTSCEEL